MGQPPQRTDCAGDVVTRLDNGGAAKACSRCGEPAAHQQGHQQLCPQHYRFGQMRATAKRRGLSVPSHEYLSLLVSPGMQCPDCDTVMNWLARDGQTFVATLQHYRDGSFGIVCRSCNTRHAFAPDDTFRDAPKDHKFCPSCRTFHPFANYAADNGRSGPLKLKSWCKSCSHEAHTKWRLENRDHYNSKQRENRAIRSHAN